jgi:hypothetical protein
MCFILLLLFHLLMVFYLASESLALPFFSLSRWTISNPRSARTTSTTPIPSSQSTTTTSTSTLQTQLQYTQFSLADHVGEVCPSEGVIIKHGAIKWEVGFLRQLAEKTSGGRGSEAVGMGAGLSVGLDDADNARSIRMTMLHV